MHPDYSWNMLIRASDPAFSCGRSPVSLEPLSIRPNRLKNRTIEPVINRLPARGTVIRRQVDFPGEKFPPFRSLPRARCLPPSTIPAPRTPAPGSSTTASSPSPLTDDENQSPPLTQRPRRHSQQPLAKTTQTPAPTQSPAHQHPTQVQDLVPQQIQQEQDFVMGANPGLRPRFRLRSRLQRLPPVVALGRARGGQGRIEHVHELPHVAFRLPRLRYRASNSRASYRFRLRLVSNQK